LKPKAYRHEKVVIKTKQKKNLVIKYNAGLTQFLRSSTGEPGVALQDCRLVSSTKTICEEWKGTGTEKILMIFVKLFRFRPVTVSVVEPEP
jgi:hypothetical protein